MNGNYAATTLTRWLREGVTRENAGISVQDCLRGDWDICVSAVLDWGIVRAVHGFPLTPIF